MSNKHEHDHTTIVRRSGKSVRRQCVCLHIGPWTKELIDTTPIPSNNPAILRTLNVVELRRKAKEAGIKNNTRMTKEELITSLTQVTA